MNLWGNRDFSDVVNLRDRQGRFSWIIQVGPMPLRGSSQQGGRRDSQRKGALLKRGRREAERPEDAAPLALQTEEGARSWGMRVALETLEKVRNGGRPQRPPQRTSPADALVLAQ